MTLQEKLKLDWIWLKLSYSFRWAHHPTCDPYSSQRFDVTIGGRQISLCQGCSLVTIGAILSFLPCAYLLMISVIEILPYLSMILLPVVPVIIIDGYSLSRPYKRLARLSLGISTGATIAGIMFYPNILAKLVGIVGLLLARSLYHYLRRLSPSKDLCQDCELLKEAPYCPGMIDKMEANKKYQEMALPVVDNQVRRRAQELGIAAEQENKDLVENSKQQSVHPPQQFNIIWVDEEETDTTETSE